MKNNSSDADRIIKCIDRLDEIAEILEKLGEIYNDFSREEYDLVEIRKLVNDALQKVRKSEIHKQI